MRLCTAAAVSRQHCISQGVKTLEAPKRACVGSRPHSLSDCLARPYWLHVLLWALDKLVQSKLMQHMLLRAHS